MLTTDDTRWDEACLYTLLLRPKHLKLYLTDFYMKYSEMHLRTYAILVEEKIKLVEKAESTEKFSFSYYIFLYRKKNILG